MSGDIGPGDLVQCVDADNLRNSLPPLRNGGLYRVERMVKTDRFGHPGVKLVGLPVTSTGWGYRTDRFRKLNDGEDDAELIARIRKCSPNRVPVTATSFPCVAIEGGDYSPVVALDPFENGGLR